MISPNKIRRLANKMMKLDLEHMDRNVYASLAKDWKVTIQDLMIANNVATQLRELKDVEKLEGGNGSQVKKTTTESLIQIFTGENKG